MTMTAPIHTINHSASDTPKPHGFGRTVQGLGVGFTKLFSPRSERAFVSYEEYERIAEVNSLRQRHDGDALYLLASGPTRS